MAKYYVLPGRRHGAFDQYGPGDVVEYEPHEAAGFMDKLELIEDTPPAPDDDAQVSPPAPVVKRVKRRGL